MLTKNPRETILLLGIFVVTFVILFFYKNDFQTSIVVATLSSCVLVFYIITDPDLYGITTRKYTYWMTVLFVLALVVIAAQQYYIYNQNQSNLYLKMYTTSIIALGVLMGISFGLNPILRLIAFILKQSMEKRVCRKSVCLQPVLEQEKWKITIENCRKHRYTKRPNYNTLITDEIAYIGRLSIYEILNVTRLLPPRAKRSFVGNFIDSLNITPLLKAKTVLSH